MGPLEMEIFRPANVVSYLTVAELEGGIIGVSHQSITRNFVIYGGFIPV